MARATAKPPKCVKVNVNHTAGLRRVDQKDQVRKSND